MTRPKPWQSNAPCQQAAELATEGADDDALLALVARYTIENLILNAVHEIGEWFRFDGQRVFPAHRSGTDLQNDQGNGAVGLDLTFDEAIRRPSVCPAPATDDNGNLIAHLSAIRAASRFTYLPRTTITFEATGPSIHRWSDRGSVAVWHSTWSDDTVDAGGDDTATLAPVAHDVHTALVLHEADRICRAFHVDGHRPWALALTDSAHHATTPRVDVPDAGSLTVSISYEGTSASTEADADLSTHCAGSS